MAHLTVAHLLAERDEHFELTPLTGQTGLHKPILSSEIHRPGLALSGYTSRFPNERAQVLGETELAYLHDMAPEQPAFVRKGVVEQEVNPSKKWVNFHDRDNLEVPTFLRKQMD